MANKNNQSSGMPKPQDLNPAEAFLAMADQADEQKKAAELEIQKEAEAKKVAETPKKIQVIATMKGFIHGQRKVEGDTFTLENEKEFSKTWMKKI